MAFIAVYIALPPATLPIIDNSARRLINSCPPSCLLISIIRPLSVISNGFHNGMLQFEGAMQAHIRLFVSKVRASAYQKRCAAWVKSSGVVLALPQQQ